MVGVEELIDKTLLDGEVTDLSAGRFQSLLDLRMRFDFEIGDDEIACEDGERARNERLVGGAMLKSVVGVDGFPDDDDEENPRVSVHQPRIDGLAAVISIAIRKDHRSVIRCKMLFWFFPGIANGFLAESLLVLP